MKRTRIAIVKTIPGTIACCLLLAMGSLLFVSYKTEKAYSDLWAQLGITKMDGNTQIRESFQFGYLQYYGARNIKKIATGDRIAVAKDLLAYTKTYVQSEAFKKEYAANRIASKPILPEPAKTDDQVRKEKMDEMKETIAKTEKTMKSIDPQYKKSFEDALVQLKKQLKEYEDPNNKIMKIMIQGEKANYEYKIKQYDTQLKQWEETMPENPLHLVKKRLQALLEVTKDVDYSAELTEKYGKKVFVNPVYERKHANWKYAFRAGKEVTETVKAFAEQWINEIK